MPETRQGEGIPLGSAGPLSGILLGCLAVMRFVGNILVDLVLPGRENSENGDSNALTFGPWDLLCPPKLFNIYMKPLRV